MFGQIVQNVTESEDVKNWYKTIMLSSVEVLEEVVGIAYNGAETGLKEQDAVMPKKENGECITFSLYPTEQQVKEICTHY